MKVNSQTKYELEENKEYILIHTDSKEYSVNEHLWFKLYCLQGKALAPSNKSILAYVELISPMGHSLVRKKILLKQGLGMGEFILPDTLSSGMYKFIAYTNWLKNYNTKKTYEKDILIYNPVKISNNIVEINKDKLKADSVIPTQKKYIHNKKNNSIKIVGLNKEYTTREKITLNLQNINDTSNSNISISIRKYFKSENYNNLFKSEELMFSKYFENNDSENRSDTNLTFKFLPENKGILLSGIVKNNKEPYKNQNIIASFVDTTMNVKLSETNNEGEFNFYLIPNQTKKDIVLAPVINPEEYSIFINSKFLDTSFISTKNRKILISKDFKVHLQEIYLNNKISILFNENIDSLRQNNLNKSIRKNDFYFQADITRKFDKYILLNSLEEYFYEIVPEVKISKKSGIKKLNILSLSTKKFMKAQPAIFIDGVYFNDLNLLLNINSTDIEKIEIIMSELFIYDKIFGGAIGIFTKNGSLKKVELASGHDRFEYRLFHEFMQFQTKNNDNIKIPDFRNTLYWNPNINIKHKANQEISFSTCDDPCLYEISINGISSNGKIISQKEFFIVNKQ